MSSSLLVSGSNPLLIPEFDVSDFANSLRFYTEVLGFSIAYDRPEEEFAMLEFDGNRLMLHSANRSRFLTGPQEMPFGRNVHFQIQVNDVDALHQRVVDHDVPLFLPMEEKWLRVGDQQVGNRQFAVTDPDGFLFRFFTDLGKRSAENPSRVRTQTDANPQGSGES